MKLPENWRNLWNDNGFVSNMTNFIQTLNGIASVILVALVVYIPYQAIREIIAWFR